MPRYQVIPDSDAQAPTLAAADLRAAFFKTFPNSAGRGDGWIVSTHHASPEDARNAIARQIKALVKSGSWSDARAQKAMILLDDHTTIEPMAAQVAA